jgi:3-deoxy-7-phosphoheptulonate synthase
MVVVMKQDATDADVEAVAEKARAAGGEAFVSRGAVHTVVGLVGDTERLRAVDWRQLGGVDHVIHNRAENSTTRVCSPRPSGPRARRGRGN